MKFSVVLGGGGGAVQSIELQDVHGVHHSNSLTRIRQILCTSAHRSFKQKYVEEYRTEERNTKLYLPTEKQQPNMINMRW